MCKSSLPIKVLHLLHKLTFGGTERVIVNLAGHSGSKVENLICGFLENDDSFVKEVPGNGRNVFSLGKKEGNDFSIPFKIASICRMHNVDIIHSLGWATYAEGLMASRLATKRKRFVHSFRGKTIEDMVHIPKRRILAQRAFSVFCDAIVTNSGESREEYAGLIGINPNRVQIIYNGVDTAKFQARARDEKNRVKREFGFEESDIVIGSVARFDPVKNLGGLIRACSGIEHPLLGRIRLLFIGDGPELDAVKGLAGQLGLNGQALFAGMRSDVPDCLQAMDMYVQPSLFENVPNSVLEAMASGLPTVATDVGGVAEIVEHGITGLLVPPNDDFALTEAIRQLAANPEKRREMGALGRNRAAGLFSIEKMVSEYEALYERVLLQA